MECWICSCKTNNICCNCKNDYKYAHKYCINLLSIIYNHKYCKFCKKKYEVYYLFYFLYNIYLFFYIISEYDVVNGNRWEDYYD